MLEDQPRAATINRDVLEGKLRQYEEAERQAYPCETKPTDTPVRMGSHATRLAAYLDDGSLDNPNIVLGSE